jgi:hypothetical protein
MGHPALRKVAQPFTVAEIKSTHTKQLVRDMKATLKHVKGLGLAAPQVGISKQLLIVEVPGDISNDIEEIPETVAFNPKLEFLLTHETIPMWESCLSVPDLVGKVERFNNTIMHYVVRFVFHVLSPKRNTRLLRLVYFIFLNQGRDVVLCTCTALLDIVLLFFKKVAHHAGRTRRVATEKWPARATCQEFFSMSPITCWVRYSSTE